MANAFSFFFLRNVKRSFICHVSFVLPCGLLEFEFAFKTSYIPIYFLKTLTSRASLSEMLV